MNSEMKWFCGDSCLVDATKGTNDETEPCSLCANPQGGTLRRSESTKYVFAFGLLKVEKSKSFSLKYYSTFFISTKVVRFIFLGAFCRSDWPEPKPLQLLCAEEKKIGNVILNPFRSFPCLFVFNKRSQMFGGLLCCPVRLMASLQFFGSHRGSCCF